MKRRLLWPVIVLAVGWLFSPLPTTAQNDDGIGLSVSPAIIEQPLTPGISTTISIKVTNISQQPLPVVVGTRPLVPLDPLVDDSLRQRYDASQWLTPLVSQLLLEPDESTSVQLVARPDDEAGVGGHYALVVFRVLTEVAADQTSLAQVNPEVTSLVLFSLPGDMVESAELALEQPPIWQFSRPGEAEFNIINRGNIHFLPISRLNFRPLIGGGAKSAETAPHLVLPGTSSAFAANWPELEWGVYRVDITTTYGTPLKSLGTSSRWFIVPPPVWIQTVVLICLIVATRYLLRFIKHHPFWRRPKKIASDTSRIGQKAKAEELDYLGSEAGVRDISQKRPRPRR